MKNLILVVLVLMAQLGVAQEKLKYHCQVNGLSYTLEVPEKYYLLGGERGVFVRREEAVLAGDAMKVGLQEAVGIALKEAEKLLGDDQREGWYMSKAGLCSHDKGGMVARYYEFRFRYLSPSHGSLTILVMRDGKLAPMTRVDGPGKNK